MNIFDLNILQLLISHIETVIVKAYPLSFQLMTTVIDEQTFDPNRLFVLFSISVGRFYLSQTTTCLTQLGEAEYLSVFDGKHPKFSYTATNQRILDAFLQKEWISSYILETDIRYRAYGKKEDKNSCNWYDVMQICQNMETTPPPAVVKIGT